jgi:hypothetical protein
MNQTYLLGQLPRQELGCDTLEGSLTIPVPLVTLELSRHEGAKPFGAVQHRSGGRTNLWT